MAGLIKPSRRSFITGLAALITAPAIVRAGSLMPVKVMEPLFTLTYPPDKPLPDDFRECVISYWFKVPESKVWQYVQNANAPDTPHYFEVCGRDLIFRSL